MNKLSVLVPVFNVEDVIRDCLESVKWADEIVVVDSFSNDRTLEICREYTDEIYQHEYINSAKQKNWALQKLSHDWTLLIDSDERLTPELSEEIKEILKNPEYDGYYNVQRCYFWGKWIKTCGMYPMRTIRLWRRSKGKYILREVHAHVDLQGPAGYLKNDWIHYAHRTFNQFIQKFNRYSSWEADELFKHKKTVRWYDFIFHPLKVFIYKYIYKKGFKDGVRGFFLSFMIAVFEYVSYAKLWEKLNIDQEEIKRQVQKTVGVKKDNS